MSTGTVVSICWPGGQQQGFYMTDILSNIESLERESHDLEHLRYESPESSLPLLASNQCNSLNRQVPETSNCWMFYFSV